MTILTAMKRIPPALWCLPILLLAGCQTTASPDQWGALYQYQSSETFRIQMTPRRFPLVPGRIAGTDIKVFFDTGNFFGPTIAPALARSLELIPSGNERKEYDSDGAYRSSRRGFLPVDFQVFRSSPSPVELFEAPDNEFPASVGVWDLLGRRFTLDMGSGLMGVSSTPFRADGRTEELPLIWNDRQKGMIVVPGTVDGVETLIQIDTGKSRTTIDESLIPLAGLKEHNTPFLKGYRVDAITLGGLSFSVDSAKVADFSDISGGYPGPILIGIGADIISRIALTVDYSQNKVFIR